MQTEMMEFDKKIFDLVCKKDELETRLKFAEISAILLYEEFQVVNQDQELEANLKAEVVRQQANLERLNVKLLEVEKHLVVKQKNVDNLKEQKKNIFEMVERELSDNKHSDILWELYNKKPNSKHQQEVLLLLFPSTLTTFSSTLTPFFFFYSYYFFFYSYDEVVACGSTTLQSKTV